MTPFRDLFDVDTVEDTGAAAAAVDAVAVCCCVLCVCICFLLTVINNELASYNRHN